VPWTTQPAGVGVPHNGYMYIPSHFAADDAVVHDLLTNHGAANLVTATPAGMLATLLPFVYDRTIGEYGALLGHVARNNEQWKVPVLGEALVIMAGPDAYISPSAYATKKEHGRVVPTWNYVTAHIYGRLVIHDDPAWLENLVRRLTEKHEEQSAEPWSVDDAPATFVAGQLRAIVGVELVINRIEAKAKLSQNRSQADVEGVVTSLEARGANTSAKAVRAASVGSANEPG
jgi:transcriptional regulator